MANGPVHALAGHAFGVIKFEITDLMRAWLSFLIENQNGERDGRLYNVVERFLITSVLLDYSKIHEIQSKIKQWFRLESLPVLGNLIPRVLNKLVSSNEFV